MDNKTDNFKTLMENGLWSEAGAVFTEVLESSSYEDLDRIDFGTGAGLRTWTTVLILTGAYKATTKGRYLFMRLIRSVWPYADDSQRWELLCCAAQITQTFPSDTDSTQACFEYFHHMADIMGVSGEEVINLAQNHPKTHLISQERTQTIQ